MDIELESDSDAQNKMLLAQYKVRGKPCSRRPIAGKPRGRSDGDASHCLGDRKRASQFKKSQEGNKGKIADDFEEKDSSDHSHSMKNGLETRQSQRTTVLSFS